MKPEERNTSDSEPPASEDGFKKIQRQKNLGFWLEESN